MAGVERLVAHSNDEKETSADETYVDPHPDSPGARVQDACHDSRTDEGRQDQRDRPHVDFSWPLMEEKDVVDPHKTAASSCDSEEAVENTRGHIGLERLSCRGPDCGGTGQGHEVEQRGQSADIGAQPYRSKTADTEHKGVTGCGMIDLVGRDMPFCRLSE